MEDRAAGDTVDLKFNTTVAGVPFTLAGTPAISVYKNNNTTESTSGVTLTVDFDGRTGLHNVNITTASDGTFYANGNDFQVVITTGTVNGNSAVGLQVGVFSLANRTVNWGSVANKTTANALTATSIITTQKVDVDTIKTNPVVNGGTITFPTTATLASTTNITAGTITTATTATNLTNAPTAGDFTATMKTSIGTAVAASAVASVTGNVGGNVTGSVGSVVGAVGSVTGNVGGNVTGSVGSLTTNNDKTGYTLSNTGIDNVLDRTAGVETSFTLRQAMRLILAAAASKLSGAATTTVKIRDINDTKDRITATVDADGNRSAVTTDVT